MFKTSKNFNQPASPTAVTTSTTSETSKDKTEYKLETTSNCATKSKIILLVGALLWTLFTYAILLWILNYLRNLRQNNYDAALSININPAVFLTVLIIYIVFSVAVVSVVLVLIFKKYKYGETQCKTGTLFRITFLIYGVIMIYAVINAVLALLFLYNPIKDAKENDDDTESEPIQIIVNKQQATFLQISSIFLLILSGVYLIFAVIILFTKNNSVIVKCKPGDTKCEEKVKEQVEKEKSSGFFGGISKRLDESKSSSLQQQFRSEDFNRIRMANITSPIDVTNVENIYPDQLKPSGSKDAKSFAEKSLEVCGTKFDEKSTRYTIANGDEKRDSCKYWGLKPNEKVNSTTLPNNKDKVYTVVS